MMSMEIGKIEKLKCSAIIKYHFSKGLKGEQIYKVMFHSLCEHYPEWVPRYKSWLTFWITEWIITGKYYTTILTSLKEKNMERWRQRCLVFAVQCSCTQIWFCQTIRYLGFELLDHPLTLFPKSGSV